MSGGNGIMSYGGGYAQHVWWGANTIRNVWGNDRGAHTARGLCHGICLIATSYQPSCKLGYMVKCSHSELTDINQSIQSVNI